MSGRKAQGSHRSASFLASLTQSPILWGGALTVGLYASIPHLPQYREMAERYFCSHPLEYATTYLFFVGIAVLVFKALAVSTERAALTIDLFEGLDDKEESFGEQLLAHLEQVPKRYRATWYITRMHDLANYLKQRQSSQTLEEHLRYLADRAADKLHSSFALVRTVTWAVPILGFLGTVVGITIAIANISLSELQNSMAQVIGGLSVSFDTTALALTLSLLLVFGSFLVERMESQVLSDVEDAGMEEIGFRFEGEQSLPKSPLIAAEQQAGEELLQQSREMIAWQSKLWQESLETMRQNWIDSLQEQEGELSKALSGSVQSSLARHEESLDESRNDFLSAFNTAAQAFTLGLNESRTVQQEIQEQFGTQIKLAQETLGEQTADSSRQLADLSQQLTKGLVGELKIWQKQLHSETESSDLQLREIRKQTEMLTRLLDKESSLSTVAERLSNNLSAVTAGNKLEEVLHNLNAAIHLLTARSLPRAG